MSHRIEIDWKKINPYIRYVNHYIPSYSYIEKERVLFDFEFMYVMEGAVEMHYNGTSYLLEKSDLFYLKPGIQNFIIVDYAKGFRTHCIHFDWIPPLPEDDFTAQEFYMHSILSTNHAEKAKALKARPIYEPCEFLVPCHIKGMPYDKFSSLFSQCYSSYLLNTTTDYLMLQASFLEIIAELTQLRGQPTEPKPVHPKIIYAIEYLRQHYQEPVNALWLSEKYGLSPKYFGTLFKAATGKSIHEFVLDLRIYAAKEMLLGTNMTITAIAEKVGFQNEFYFSNCFKGKEKISPSKYRSIMTKS